MNILPFFNARFTTYTSILSEYTSINLTTIGNSFMGSNQKHPYYNMITYRLSKKEIPTFLLISAETSQKKDEYAN